MGKLIDYRERPRGIFLTTSQRISADVFSYSIAHRISVVSPTLAPIDYMMQQVKKGTDLHQRLLSLESQLRDPAIPRQVLIQWQNEFRRFRAEGYS